VDTHCIQIDPERPTGTVRVELEEGEPRFTLAEQAAWDRIVYTPEVRDAIAASRAICYGTLAQRTALGLGALGRALAEAPREVARVCDLNVRLPHTTREAVDAALASANVVKLNRAEAGVLETLYGVSDAIEWLLRERGVELVAWTLGESGAELVSSERRARAAAIPAVTGDRVGAGDAFTAALAHAWVAGAGIEVAAERANRYAAFVASQAGAMPEVPDEVVRVIAH
jgi:fructokinase